MKPLEFLGDSLDAIRDFSEDVRRETGFQLDKVQRDYMPDDWKPLKTIGKGVSEIRIRDESGAYRIIYIAKLLDAVYVLHAFQKKTQKTRDVDLSLAKRRLKTRIERQT